MRSGPAEPSIGARLVGQGPFVEFEVELPRPAPDSDPVYQFQAVDLGSQASRPLILGTPPGGSLLVAPSFRASGANVPVVMVEGSNGSSLPSAKTLIWRLTCGAGFDDEPIVLEREEEGWLASPDAAEILVLASAPGGDGERSKVDAVIVAPDSPPRTLGRIPREGSEVLGLGPIVG